MLENTNGTKERKQKKRGGERNYALHKNYFLLTNLAILDSFADYSYVFECGEDWH